MYTNYNVLTLTKEDGVKYKEGDIFKAPDKCNWLIKRFDGLCIKYIDYVFGTRLHFDHDEWFNNTSTLRQNKDGKWHTVSPHR